MDCPVCFYFRQNPLKSRPFKEQLSDNCVKINIILMVRFKKNSYFYLTFSFHCGNIFIKRSYFDI